MREQSCRNCFGKGEEKIEVDDMYGYVGSYTQSCEACEGTGKETVYDKKCIVCGTDFEGLKDDAECEPCWQHRILTYLEINENEAE